MFWSRSRSDRAAAHRYVDMWAFMGLHPTNIDVLQRLKQADDQRFGANMDVCGTVSEKNPKTSAWAESHLVGIRADIWNPDAGQQQRQLERLQKDREQELRREIVRRGRLNEAQKKSLKRQLENDPVMHMRPQDIENRRLVMKLFRTSSERMNWAGTVEEVVSRELHNSLGSKKGVLSFASALQGYDYMTFLQENNRTFRIPSIFSFSFYDLKHDRMWYLKIKRKWISVGADFVVESQNRQIGEIDGALVGLGYNAHVYIDEPTLASNRKFVDLITLFATTVGYQKSMRRSLKRRIRATKKGLSVQNVIEDEEYQLLRNPRAA